MSTQAAGRWGFAVTFNRRSDDATGLRVMTLGEAEKLMAFIALRGMAGARIIAVGRPAASGVVR
jgi:hypothetical protein